MSRRSTETAKSNVIPLPNPPTTGTIRGAPPPQKNRRRRHAAESEQKVTKYAPANEKGEKPYVVEQSGWGRRRQRVVYADSVATAKYRAFGRQGVGESITGCRRATIEDVAEQ